ncbi:MAG TPA: hypothetical protein VFG56_01830, partial [Candidatus Saccharimonadales bacterium]|nr:hypothetical protein [Candidatus Saccharimonadales bacterium]
MKAKEIDRLPIKPDIPPSSRKIRRFAPKYLESIIASRVMPGVKSIDELRPEHIEALSGGNDAAIYLVNSPEHN